MSARVCVCVSVRVHVCQICVCYFVSRSVLVCLCMCVCVCVYLYTIDHNIEGYGSPLVHQSWSYYVVIAALCVWGSECVFVYVCACVLWLIAHADYVQASQVLPTWSPYSALIGCV